VAQPSIVAEFGDQLAGLGWVTDLFVAGSLSTGDYVVGVSDLDLVAVTDGPVDAGREAALVAVHRRLDAGEGARLKLGCVYVDAGAVIDVSVKHPTWTHGLLVQRILSGITRAELARHGYPVFGRAIGDVFETVTDDDVRAAAHAELTGYWAWAARRPWLWLDPVLADLGLTSMARGRHALATGALLTKTRAAERIDAPAWLVAQVRARRRGENVRSPRLRTALIAWRDARRTVARAKAPR